MKNFDFVKFTLVLVGILTLGVGGGYVWARTKEDQARKDLLGIKARLAEIGQFAAQLDMLKKQRDQDRALGKPAATYFAEQARTVGIDFNNYKLTPKVDDNPKSGIRTEEFRLDFKPGGKKSRDRLYGFVYHVEAFSPGMKLVELDLRLDEKTAVEDQWTANMTFLRQRPIRSGDTN